MITDEEIQRLRTTHSSDLSKPWLIVLALRMADEMDRLRKENAELGQGWMDERAIQDRVAATNLAKLAKAREALAFYADENNWESNRFTDEWGPAFDDGNHARAVLKELSE